jgi:hypothetical protein
VATRARRQRQLSSGADFNSTPSPSNPWTCDGLALADISFLTRAAIGTGPSGSGRELEALGHAPRLHDWEIKGGDDTMAWMVERHDKADFILGVVSDKWLRAAYSKVERMAGGGGRRRRNARASCSMSSFGPPHCRPSATIASESKFLGSGCAASQDRARGRLRGAVSRRLPRDMVDQGADGVLHARRPRRAWCAARLGCRRGQGRAWRGFAIPVEIRLWPREIGAEYLIARTGRTAERAAAEALSEALGGLPARPRASGPIASGSTRQAPPRRRVADPLCRAAGAGADPTVLVQGRA